MNPITFDKVSFQYHARSPIIKNLSFNLDENQIIVLLGPNGAGKSTFLKLCLGFLSPTTGAVLIHDTDIKHQTPSWIGHHIAYSPQKPTYPYHLSVRDYILLGRTPHLQRYESPQKEDLKMVDAILKQLQIEFLANRTMQEISGGEQQMASFGRILVQGTPIILVDEITSDLDIKNTLRVIQTMSALKKEHTILFSTHDPQIAEAIADSIILFKPNNTISSGKPNELLTPTHLAALYDIPSSFIQENPIQIRWNHRDK